MDAERNLELARRVYPNDENLRVAYMLGLEKCYDVAREEMIDKACEWIQDNLLTSEQLDRGYSDKFKKAMEE